MRTSILLTCLLPFLSMVGHSQQRESDSLNLAKKEKVTTALNRALECLPEHVGMMIRKGSKAVDVKDWKVTVDGRLFDASFDIYSPWLKKSVTFVARNIHLEEDRHAGDERYRLEFASEVRSTLHENLDVYIPGGYKNFVVWDCDGFQSMSLAGKFIFTGDQIRSSSPYTDEVSASFEFKGSSMDDFVVNAKVTPFHLTGNDGTVYVVQDAMIDLSPKRNPAGLPDYRDKDGVPVVSGDDWMGFYFKKLRVYVADKESENEKVAVIGSSYFIDDLMVDKSGVSGRIGGDNILRARNLEQGTVFSFDRFFVEFVRNELTGLKVDMSLKQDGRFKFSVGYRPEK